MSLEFAVDRLYETGWTPDAPLGVETLPDGRRYPSVLAVQEHFARAGLELSIKHNLVFGCFRAHWTCLRDPTRSGTVVGNCEREAAVYALAQLLAHQQEVQLAGV
jgi:hypothetical protein